MEADLTADVIDFATRRSTQAETTAATASPDLATPSADAPPPIGDEERAEIITYVLRLLGPGWRLSYVGEPR